MPADSLVDIFDLVRSLADFVRTFVVSGKFKENYLQYSVQKGCPKFTTNPSTHLSKLHNIDSESIKHLQNSRIFQSEPIREKGRFQDPNKCRSLFVLFVPVRLLGAIVMSGRPPTP